MRSLSRSLPAPALNCSSRSVTVIFSRFSPLMSSTMWPLSIIRVRLPSSRAFFMLWVTIRVVILCCCTTRRVMSSTFSAVAGSRAAVCSSSSSSLGGTIVAIIRVSAWRWPPDSRPTGWLIRSSRPMFSTASCSRKKARSFFPTRAKKACWFLAVRR